MDSSSLMKMKNAASFPVADMNTVLSCLTDGSDIEYILEVDLEYPKALRALHNDYPLASEALEISNDMLSPLLG